MKAIIAIFALCLVAVNAGTIDPAEVNLRKIEIDGILNEMVQIAKDAAIALRHQLEATVLDPLQQVQTAVDGIEARREESVVCVAAQDENVVATVDDMHKEMAGCGVVAAKTSAKIISDISAATQQLVFGSYDFLNTYKRCLSYTSIILKSSCFLRATIKATSYVENARKSIKTIRQSTKEGISAAMADANNCTHTAAKIAIQQLDDIHVSLDSCICKF